MLLPATVLAALLSAPGADFGHQIKQGLRTRTYEVHLPPVYDGKTPLPAVINLHGGGSNAAWQRVQTQMDTTADNNGFIVIYPEGTAPPGSKLYTWNAGSCCAYAVANNIDDVGFIDKVLDDVKTRYAVDQRRVYATGMSNGSMMAYRLACQLPSRIAAICGVAGIMGVDGPVPSRRVPVLHIHGLLDQYEPFNGGRSINTQTTTNFKPVRDVIGWWCDVDKCNKTPIVSHGDNYDQEIYFPQAADGMPVVLYILPEGGHTWPGGVDLSNGTAGKLIPDFYANAVMWQFFQKFALPVTADAK